MKAIDERAVALMETLPCDEPKSLVYEAYRKGALDQHKIDVEKACKWLYECVGSGEGFKRTFVEKFRKAMEE